MKKSSKQTTTIEDEVLKPGTLVSCSFNGGEEVFFIILSIEVDTDIMVQERYTINFFSLNDNCMDYYDFNNKQFSTLRSTKSLSLDDNFFGESWKVLIECLK